LKITAKGIYALNALLDLSYRYTDDVVIPLAEIASRRRMPLKFLEQIMLILKKAGYVTSRRGIGGGFTLKKPPDSITVGQVIRLVEGDLDIFSGISPNENKTELNHPLEKYEEMAIQEMRRDIVTAIDTVVNSVTLADLIHRAEELRAENTGYIYQI
jgi:Rrf2 family protein